jgi:uncharacterized coiled-coil DUF342 family protein
MSVDQALSSVENSELWSQIWEAREDRDRLSAKSQALRDEIIIIHERVKDLKKRISKLENNRIIVDRELWAVMDHLNQLLEKKRGNN